MQIESIIRRKNGTTVVLGETEYQFGPSDGPHIATVENEAHIERFLSIPEGFRVYGDQPAKQEDTSQEEANERDTLVAAYEAKYGKKPHYKMGMDKLREAVE